MNIQKFNSVTEIIAAYKQLYPKATVASKYDKEEGLILEVLHSTTKQKEIIPIRDCSRSGYYMVVLPD